MDYVNRIPLWSFLCVACITALALIWFGADGVRGTDQYSYVADVERIVNGQPPITNLFFPGEIVRNNALPDKNYITHNSPMLYIVAVFASVFSAYHAWILVNVICHLTVASVLFLLARKFTNYSIATGVTVFYLISPIAIWQTINPLLEMYFSALLALILLCFFNRHKLLIGCVLWLLLALGVVSHPIFVIPALLYGLVWLYEHRYMEKVILVPLLIGYYTIIYFFLQNKNLWFPSSFAPNLTTIIASVVPGKSNMVWYFSELLPELNTQLFYDKFVSAVREHTIVLKFAPFYMFTNLAILGTLCVSLFNFKRWWPAILPLGLFGSQYLAMIFLQQNHPRFQQIIAVVTFLTLAIVVCQWKKSWLLSRFIGARTVVCFFWFFLFLANSYIVYTAKNESIEERNDLSALVQQMDRFLVGDENRLVAIDVQPHSPFASAVRPTDVLFLRTSMLSEKKMTNVTSLFDPNFIIAPSNVHVCGKAAVETNIKLMSKRFGDLVVYSVDELISKKTTPSISISSVCSSQ